MDSERNVRGTSRNSFQLNIPVTTGFVFVTRVATFPNFTTLVKESMLPRASNLLEILFSSEFSLQLSLKEA